MTNGTLAQSQPVALVTGVGSGIGRAIALAFGARGSAVVVIDASAEAVAATAEMTIAAGGAALAVTADVRDGVALGQAVAAAVTRFGGLDVVCANAGVGFPDTPLVETPDEEIERMIDVNLLGAIRTVKTSIPAIRPGGAIVLTASTSGLHAHAGASVYAATKIALIGFARSLALELAPHVRVNCVCPGAVDTPLLHRLNAASEIAAYRDANPLGAVATPESVAAAVVFLATATHVTGVALRVDGGDGVHGSL